MNKTQFSKAILGVTLVGATLAALVIYSPANAQSSTAGAIAGSQSGSAAQAGAIGIQVNTGAPSGGAGIAGTSSTASGGTSNTSLFSPVGLGVSSGGSGGGGGSASSNASPTIVVGSGNTYEAADLSKAVPTLFIPNLTTSNNTCALSMSAGLALSGFGGSVGSTYVSDECNRRFDANQVLAIGGKSAQLLSLEIMCESDSVYFADMRMAKTTGSLPRCASRDEVTHDGMVQVKYAPPSTVAMLDGTPPLWQWDYPDLMGEK